MTGGGGGDLTHILWCAEEGGGGQNKAYSQFEHMVIH